MSTKCWLTPEQLLWSMKVKLHQSLELMVLAGVDCTD